MPNSSLPPSRVPWERRKQGGGSSPGEREKLSTSRESLRKMETVSEVKGTGNSQGFGARGQQVSKGRADLTQEAPAGPWGGFSTKRAASLSQGPGTRGRGRGTSSSHLFAGLGHFSPSLRAPREETRRLDFPPPLRQDGG